MAAGSTRDSERGGEKPAVGSERERVLLQIAEAACEALCTANRYLDGFVWLDEPEFSELEGIKATSKRCQRMLDEVRGGIRG